MSADIRVTIDVSPSSALVICHTCGGWWTLQEDRAAALRAAHAHERAAHPGSSTISGRIASARHRGATP